MTLRGDVRVSALYVAMFAWRASFEPWKDAMVWVCICVGAIHLILMLVCTLVDVGQAWVAKAARKVTLK